MIEIKYKKTYTKRITFFLLIFCILVASVLIWKDTLLLWKLGARSESYISDIHLLLDKRLGNTPDELLAEFGTPDYIIGPYAYVEIKGLKDGIPHKEKQCILAIPLTANKIGF